MKMICRIILCTFVFQVVNSMTFVQFFGLSDLLMDLGKASPIVNNDGSSSLAYTLDPSIFNFLKNFANRTEFCNYKCPNFYSLPCFLLFGCNIHLRNFILIIIIPLLFLIFLALCTANGIWTFRCWARYIALFTGIVFWIWLVKKCVEGNKVRERRQKERNNITEKHENNAKAQMDDCIDIGPAQTEKPIIKYNSSQSSD